METHAIGGEAATETPELVAEMRGAAEWLADRLKRADGARAGIGMVCVDVEGARCAWLDVGEVADAAVAAAMMDDGRGGDVETVSAARPPLWADPSTEDSTVQAIAAAPAKGRRKAVERAGRLAVVALPDVAVRLVLDELDDRGVGVERVTSLWHAMALAWDPGRRSGAAGDAIEAEGPASAVVLIDAAEGVGRLVWCWARGGSLVAGGSMRLSGLEDGLQLGSPEVGRLTAEWLGWATQLGVVPARVVVVSPDLSGDPNGGGLPAFGAALVKAWPGASVDVARHDDAIGATLLRLARMDAEGAGEVVDRRQSLVALSRRPGRAHRGLYRGVALALLLAAGAAGAVAWKSLGAARAAEAEARKIRAELTERVTPRVTPGNAVQVSLAQDNPVALLEDVLQRERARMAPLSDVAPAMPVLHELAALSAVLGNELVQIREIDLSPLQVRVELSVPDLETAELIKESLDTFRDTACEWQRQILPAGAEGRVSVTLLGSWKRGAGLRSGGRP